METLFRYTINASELFYSLPCNLSYLAQSWQFTIAPKENFPISKAAYFIFWSFFVSIAAYQPPIRSILFLGVSVIPKIYNRYKVQNYSHMRLDPFQRPIDRVREIIDYNYSSKITDYGLRYLAKFSLAVGEPEIVKKMIKNWEWEDIRNKNVTRSALISYYLRGKNPNAVEEILFSNPYENSMDIITLFKYYLNEKIVSKALNLVQKFSLTNGSWEADYCMIYFAIYHLKEKNTVRATQIIDAVITSTDAPHKGLAFTAAHYLKKGDIKTALAYIEKTNFSAKHPLEHVK